jgi:hypothetical protein
VVINRQVGRQTAANSSIVQILSRERKLIWWFVCVWMNWHEPVWNVNYWFSCY